MLSSVSSVTKLTPSAENDTTTNSLGSVSVDEKLNDSVAVVAPAKLTVRWMVAPSPPFSPKRSSSAALSMRIAPLLALPLSLVSVHGVDDQLVVPLVLLYATEPNSSRYWPLVVEALRLISGASFAGTTVIASVLPARSPSPSRSTYEMFSVPGSSLR